MADEAPPPEATEPPIPISGALDSMLRTYLVRAQKTLQRCQDLLELHGKLESDGLDATETQTSDLLRAVVVLTHACMEDTLRTVGKYALPAASREALDDIPFYVGGRSAQKVSLGYMTEYRGQTVEMLIAHTVENYLERMTFSSTTDIVNLLRRIGISLDGSNMLPALDEMINRRHEIVHRADIGEDWRPPVEIEAETVRRWIGAVSALVIRIGAELIRNETGEGENEGVPSDP